MPKYRLTVEHPAVNIWEVEVDNADMALEAVLEYEEGVLVDSYTKPWSNRVVSIEEVKEQ
jgi:hypothetical protein